MVEHTVGNLLLADAEALVNTVNTVGRMGKGIALQFKQAFPDNFRAYERACKAKQVKPGHMFIVETGRMVNPRYIINFPTKRHWRGKSKLEDIESGLKALVDDIKRLGIRSIAVPPLGCGNEAVGKPDSTSPVPFLGGALTPPGYAIVEYRASWEVVFCSSTNHIS